MPPIRLIDVAPSGVSAGAEAYVDAEGAIIYLITTSHAFREALGYRGPCGPSAPLRKLASILAHEEWHVRRGPDERSAYLHQLVTLLALGAAPGGPEYRGVQRAMTRVLDAQRRTAPDRVLASRSN